MAGFIWKLQYNILKHGTTEKSWTRILQLLLSIKANLRNMDTWKINSANKIHLVESESRERWQICMWKPQLTHPIAVRKTAFFEMWKPKKEKKKSGSNMNCTTFQIWRIWVWPMRVLDPLRGVEPQRQWRGESVSVIQLSSSQREKSEEKGRGEDVYSSRKTGTWDLRAHINTDKWEIRHERDRREKLVCWNMSTEVLNGALGFPEFSTADCSYHGQMWFRQLQISPYTMTRNRKTSPLLFTVDVHNTAF